MTNDDKEPSGIGELFREFANSWREKHYLWTGIFIGYIVRDILNKVFGW